MSSRAMNAEERPFANPGLFDAHCDTVMKVLDAGEDFLRSGGSKHVSFADMVRADVRVQVFACFVLSSRYPGAEYERACRMIDTVEEMAVLTQGALRVVRTGGELQEAFCGGPRAGILALEGADPLGMKAEAIREFHERGVRSLIFAWQDNAFSGTAFGENTPLTDQGRRLLGLCEELGIMVDVSHLSDKAFDEVARLSSKSFVATHSNCRALCPSLRNLTDGMIRVLAERGGVMGINFAPSFLDPAYKLAVDPLFEASKKPDTTIEKQRELRERMLLVPRPPLEWVVSHVLHAIDVGGEDCIGLGADLDGIEQTPAGIDTVADVAKLVPLLYRAGLTDRQVEKICYRNFLRAFADVLPVS